MNIELPGNRESRIKFSGSSTQRTMPLESDQSNFSQIALGSLNYN